MKMITCTLFSLLFLCGCGPTQEEYNQLIRENGQLKEEISEIKYGAPRLLSQAKEYLRNGELDSAESKLHVLIRLHNEAFESTEGRALLVQISSWRAEDAERAAWENVENTNDISALEIFVSTHPKSKYLDSVSEKIQNLKVQNELADYQKAESQNSSYTWKKFVADYPNRTDIDEIKKKIISAEIDEIYSSRDVGSLPSSYQVGNGSAATSDIAITNSTGYLLTVRYSGPEVKAVSIAPGETRTVYLLSGQYRVAASAGSASCAGTELLHGSYTSSYRITTSRYRY
jgi:hypothetical protein